eukprot:TRINITY_DN23328_c0_g1_i1.p1 TRINITY_DN23328_c0_g1~~TRINITY_DN23328_c0_g1_i1.p1  ORF type:complete len:113 (-),score=17.13 TRINITY_DN23328_c0_g1_i1:91-429(-)
MTLRGVFLTFSQDDFEPCPFAIGSHITLGNSGADTRGFLAHELSAARANYDWRGKVLGFEVDFEQGVLRFEVEGEWLWTLRKCDPAWPQQRDGEALFPVIAFHSDVSSAQAL